MRKINFIRSYNPNLSELYTMSLLRDSFDVVLYIANKSTPDSNIVHSYNSINGAIKYLPLSKYILKTISYYGIIAPILGVDHFLERESTYNVSDATYYHAYQLAKHKKKYDLKIVMNRWETIPFNYDRNKIMSSISKVVLKNLDGIINITPLAEKATEIEGTNYAKGITLPCSVDTDQFQPREKPAFLLEKYNLKSDDFIILYIGQIVWKKGIHDLIYALKLLINEKELDSNKIKLVILGSGKEEKKVRETAKFLNISNHIITTGFVPFDQVKSYYNLSDVFVSLSQTTRTWNEQLGFSVLEAMASGLPIVVSATGALNQVIKTAGLKIAAGDFAGLAENLKKLISDKQLASTLADRSLEVIQSNYSKDIIMPRLVKFYEEL